MASASLWVYRVLFGGLLPFAVPALKLRQMMTGKKRPRFRDRLGWKLPGLTTDGVWIQAVSVGEVEVARQNQGLGRRCVMSSAAATDSVGTCFSRM